MSPLFRAGAVDSVGDHVHVETLRRPAGPSGGGSAAEAGILHATVAQECFQATEKAPVLMEPGCAFTVEPDAS